MPKREFVVDERGKKKAIVIPIAEYERLLEDLHDLAVLAERRGKDEVEISKARENPQPKVKDFVGILKRPLDSDEYIEEIRGR